MGNSKQTIEQRVKLLIADTLGVELEEVTDDSLLYDHLNADSLDAVEIIMEIEKEFNIQISDQIAEDLKTVRQHVEIVHKLYSEELEVDLSNENVKDRV